MSFGSSTKSTCPRRKQWRVWSRLGALCVVLGLLASVGVAWGWALLPPPTPTDWFSRVGPTILVEGDRRIALQYMKEVGFAGSKIELKGRVKPEFLFCATGEPELDDVGFANITDNAVCRNAISRHEALLRSPYTDCIMFSVVLAGWPEPCLAYEDACTAEEYQRFGPLLMYNMRTGEIESPPTMDDQRHHLQPTYYTLTVADRHLPLLPLWPGLLANTAFYGGAWAVLIGGPILLRRWLRARRGGCPACGYSREGLKVDAPCPECGRTTPAAHDATPTPTAR